MARKRYSPERIIGQSNKAANRIRASNTTNFLGLLERDGLLRYHKVKEPRMRDWLFGTIAPMAHSTAVIEESETEESYVVDSWFFDNDQPAAIAPLDDRLSGWSPEGAAWV